MIKRPFTVIDGGPAPDTPKERRRKRIIADCPPELVRCPRCSGNEVEWKILGMFWSATKRPVGGQKQLVCSTCERNGQRTVIWF